MDVCVRYTGEKKFEITARTHRLTSDQPAEHGGTDTGMTPPELFLSSVGACAAYYAAEYLRARSLPSQELEIRVSGEKGGRPTRITSLRIDVVAPGLDQRHQDGVLRAIESCLIKNTLMVPPSITTRLLPSEAAVPVSL